MPSPRNHIIQLIEQGALPAESIDLALKASKIMPDGRSWLSYIDHLLLWLGSLAIAFAVLFFTAYNWESLGRFAQFGLVQLLIIGAILLYIKLDPDKINAKASLLVASILVGALLALYGQTYQTGADPWQLFFYWALLILPWVLIARFSALWITWLLLLNVSILLYQQTFHSLLWMAASSDTDTLLIVFVFNSAALIIWELLATRFVWLAERWPVRLLAVACGICMTILAIYSIFDQSEHYGSAWIVTMSAMLYVYLKLRPDLFMLAGICLSGITVTILFFSEAILDQGGMGGFLLLALLTIGMGTGAAIWLNRLHREWQV